MKRVLSFLIAMLLVSAAFAQTKAKPKAAPALPFDDGSRIVQLDEQLAKMLIADKGQCDKMATDIKAFYAKNGAEVHRLAQEGQKRTKEQQAEFQKKYGTRLQAVTQAMNVNIGGCIQNPKVQEALKVMN